MCGLWCVCVFYNCTPWMWVRYLYIHGLCAHVCMLNMCVCVLRSVCCTYASVVCVQAWMLFVLCVERSPWRNLVISDMGKSPVAQLKPKRPHPYLSLSSHSVNKTVFLKELALLQLWRCYWCEENKHDLRHVAQGAPPCHQCWVFLLSRTQLDSDVLGRSFPST